MCEFIQGPNLCLGSIRKFCVLKEGHIAIIDVYEQVPEGLLDAFKPSLQELKTVRNTLLNRYFAIVKKISVSNQLVAVSVNAIKQKCVHVPIKHSPTDMLLYSNLMFMNIIRVNFAYYCCIYQCNTMKQYTCTIK